MAGFVTYSLPQVLHVTVDGLKTGMHMIISSHYSNSNMTIFRNVSNKLDFLVKDIDRQPVNLGSDLRLIVWTAPELPAVLEKPLAVVNAIKGHYRVVVTGAEARALKCGSYSWSLIHRNAGEDSMIFTNRDYATKGTLRVAEGIPPQFGEPLELDPQNFTLDGLGVTNHVSSAIPASGLASGQNSVVYQMANYSGRITIQGTLEASVPTNEGWFQISTEEFVNTSGNIHRPFEGNYTFTRFVVSNTSGLGKITYRN